MIKSRLFYVMIFLINTAVLIASNTAPPLIIEVVILLLPAFSLAYTALFARTLKIECGINSYTETGKETYVDLKLITRFKKIPGLLVLHNKIVNNLLESTEERDIIINSDFIGKSNKITLVRNVCGAEDFYINHVECYDALHLFKVRVKFNYEQQLRVYPAPIAVHADASKSFFTEREGKIYDIYKKGSDRSEVLEIRNYVYGDNIKDIHWKLSSKLNKTVVREFSRSTNLNTLIFCDLSRIGGASEEDVSNIIGLTFAMSKSMIDQGIAHGVKAVYQDGSLDCNVENMNDYTAMCDDFLLIRVGKGEFDAGAAFINLGLGYGFSKFVYITKDYNHETMRLISAIGGLTVVTIHPDGKNTVESNGFYDIISIDSSSLGEAVHNLEV